ncbi:MAG: neutral/alkaline non-lysosomal ceramidase N-terminal domain-containing protein [Terracidiphilus sp.]|nr:neutral/alkaline non-lysosomal ceramidase N-terminal domain-containing protein [Terracidiphilus sp.]
MKVGVAQVDITPPPGVAMWGFGPRQSSGTLDPLYARVLVLETGNTRIAVVTLDLGRCFGPDTVETIRNAVRKSSGISYVMLVASHTHAGPVVQDTYSEGKPAWEIAAIAKIEKAIDDAHAGVEDARLGTGYGLTYIGHNRLRGKAEGGFFERNPTQIPTSPVDPTVSVLRVDRVSDGTPMAILVNYACHPVTFGADNRQYSADFPGVMSQTISQAFASHPLSMFLQGASGDINAFYSVTPLEQNPVHWRDWAGKRLGNEAVRVAKQIKTTSDTQPSIDFSQDTMSFHFRWNAEAFRDALLSSDEIHDASERKAYYEAYAPPSTGDQHVPLATVLLDKRIAIIGVAGEAFVNFQSDWRNRCPVDDCFFFGYANGYSGYIPTLTAAAKEGGFGANSGLTWLEPGAGESMIDHALVKVYQMLGLLTDKPQ